MNYSYVLDKLYGDNHYEIEELLNQSVFAEHYIPENKGDVIHTGFNFEIHTGLKLDILFDLTRKQVIRQTRRGFVDPPLFNGVIVLKEDYNFFKSYLVKTILSGISDDDLLNTFVELNNPNDLWCIPDDNRIVVTSIESKKTQIISSFSVFAAEDRSRVIAEYPFNRYYRQKFYFRKEEFQLISD